MTDRSTTRDAGTLALDLGIEALRWCLQLVEDA